MWADGDRELRCGLQSASRTGAMYPTVGRVADSDQSAVQEPGTCLAIDGRTVGDPVACVGPHAVETVGILDLSSRFPGPFPQVADQDEFLQPECAKIANSYAGGENVISAKKLTVYWDNVTEESWNAGTRKINCNLAALLPDRSGFAPVTGSVTGDVVVGDSVAPPASTTRPAPQDPVVPPAPADEQAPERAAADEPAGEAPAANRPDPRPSTATPAPEVSRPSAPAVPLPDLNDVVPEVSVGNAGGN